MCILRYKNYQSKTKTHKNGITYKHSQPIAPRRPLCRTRRFIANREGEQRQPKMADLRSNRDVDAVGLRKSGKRNSREQHRRSAKGLLILIWPKIMPIPILCAVRPNKRPAGQQCSIRPSCIVSRRSGPILFSILSPNSSAE